MNWVKTFLLMGLMTGLLMLIGEWLGGRQGLVMAFGFAVLMNFGSYWFSDKIVLAMYGAKEVDESEAPELFDIVRRLTAEAHLPMPKVYIIPAAQPNAFATGRNPSHAAVAVTEGIMRMLNRDELEGVIAHELTHVKNRDILIGTIAATIAGAVMMASRMAFFFGGSSDDDRGPNPLVALLVMILAPLAALLIQMAISRSREYDADAGGADVSHKPLALAGALRKLERGAEAVPMDANPATAHMFIVSPFAGGGISSLFSTHPRTEDRIAKLEEMSRNA